MIIATQSKLAENDFKNDENRKLVQIPDLSAANLTSSAKALKNIFLLIIHHSLS